MAVLQNLLDAYRWRRWPRRALVAVLLLAASVAALARPPSRAPVIATRPVAVALHGLAAGQLLRGTDIGVSRWPVALVPDGAAGRASDVVGRRVAGPVGRGEAVTRGRLVGPGLTAGLPDGEVAVPIVVDGTAAFLEAGDHIDLYAEPVDATGAPTGRPTPVAADRLVLAVVAAPGAGPAADPLDQGGGTELVLALDGDETPRVLAAQRGALVAVITPPP